jgi:hypothetical protein
MCRPFTILCSIIIFSLLFNFALAEPKTKKTSASLSKPFGKNCNLSAPPKAAGEENGHGFLLQIYPRKIDISSSYTGCQVIFAKASSEPAKLAWLVEIIKGDPVRIWTTDKEMKGTLDCRYKSGKLIKGNPESCLVADNLIMASLPAGCLLGKKEEECHYD